MTLSNQRLDRLLQIGAAFAAIEDQDELLLQTVEAAKDLTGATYSSIAQLEGDWLHWRSAAGKPIEEVRGYKQPMNEGICGWVVQNGRSRRSRDVLQEPDYFQQYAEMRSELDVPLLHGEEVIGVLNVESPEIDAFSSEDEATLKVLAVFAAIFIQNQV